MHVRSVTGPIGREMYISAQLPPTAEAANWSALFEPVAQALRSAGADILQERLFAGPGEMDAALQARRQACGDLADAVRPGLLVTGEGVCSPALQIHALVGHTPPHVLRTEGGAVAKVVETPSGRFVSAAGLTGNAPSRNQQVQQVYEQADDLLRQAGGDLRSLARTWLWLDHILDWYGDFNKERTACYLQAGIINGRQPPALPASTGVGLTPWGTASCGLDFVGFVGQPQPQFMVSAGHQKSAFNYGSAFARAAIVPVGSGRAVYVSGTAAIDETGRTTNVGNAPGQIRDTLDNVRAVLKEADCTDEDVVQAIVYCKTPEVFAQFAEEHEPLHWPHVTVVCDICRPELLFEIEVTACPGALSG